MLKGTLTISRFNQETREHDTAIYNRVTLKKAVMYYDKGFDVWIMTKNGSFRVHQSVFHPDLRKYVSTLRNVTAGRYEYYAIAEEERTTIV